MLRLPSTILALALVPACFTPNQVDPIPDETDAGEATGTTGATAGGMVTAPGSSGTSSGGGATLPTGVESTGTETGDTAEIGTGAESSTGEVQCEGPLVACGTGACEIDRMADPLHCGECGHDCLGGECDAGECQPVSLFVEGDLRDLAADEDYVYFVTAGTLERIPQQLMPDPEILADDGPDPGPGKREIEATGEGIILTGGIMPDGFVRLISLNGAPAQGLDFDATYNTPTALTSTSNRVFWVGRNDVPLPNPDTYAVLGTTLDGADNRTYAAGLEQDSLVAANSAFVFFSSEAGIQRRGVGGGGGSATTVLAPMGCHAMVAADERIYLACRGDGDQSSLIACDLDGSNIVTLLEEGSPFFSDGFSLLVEDGRLTWWDFEDDGNHLRDVAEDGSGARTLYSTLVPVTNQRLALDSEAFFFAEDATIQMLAR